PWGFKSPRLHHPRAPQVSLKTGNQAKENPLPRKGTRRRSPPRHRRRFGELITAIPIYSDPFDCEGASAKFIIVVLTYINPVDARNFYELFLSIVLSRLLMRSFFSVFDQGLNR